ncbi:MAG: nucleoside triphosphate pyrophosphohydrolase [Oscillospiraceae bacterium]|nr:nucleoside triphosphate pyrophosphohydrolase [Oscillospiraceae bacterium]
MTGFELKDKYDVYDLYRLTAVLRGENGCPWDRVQTHESIRNNFIEEVYEVCEAIYEKSTDHLREELGDVLLQVMFHASIEEDACRFDINDVADECCKKLILRHPHVFGDVQVSGADEVLVNWDSIKRVEKNQETVTDTLKAVAKSLPSLWRARKLQKRAAKVGFDWPAVDGALEKLEEEVRELRQAIEKGEGVMDELGDVLFSAVNVSRFTDTDPEDALTFANEKFIRRFGAMEALAEGEGKVLEDMSLDEMERLYQEGKQTERSNTNE